MKKNPLIILLNWMKNEIGNGFSTVCRNIFKMNLRKAIRNFVAHMCIIAVVFSTVITSFLYEQNITYASEVKDYTDILSIYGVYAKKIALDDGSHIVDIAVDICLNELDVNDYGLSESACVCMDVVLVNSEGEECKVGNFGRNGYIGWGVSGSFSCVMGYDDIGMTALYHSTSYADEYTYQTDDEPYEIAGELSTRKGQLENGYTLWESFLFSFSKIKINFDVVDGNVISLYSFCIDLEDVYLSNNMNRGQDYREYSVPNVISKIRYIKTIENSITDSVNGKFKLKLKIPCTRRSRWINDGEWTPGIMLYNEYGDSYIIHENTIDLKEDCYRKFDNHYWWNETITVEIPDEKLNRLGEYSYKAFVKCGEETWYGEEYSFKNENADVIETVEMSSNTLSESTNKFFNVAMKITSAEASSIGENWFIGIVLKDPNGNYVSYKAKDLMSSEIDNNIDYNISISGLDKLGRYEYKAFAACGGKIWYGETYEFYNLITFNSDKITTSDIFYKYPKALNPSTNISISNYQCNTSGIISKAKQEYIDSGYFSVPVWIDGFKNVSDSTYVLKLLTQALTDYNVTEYGYIDDYYGAAEPPVRCGESHLSGPTEPLLMFIN